MIGSKGELVDLASALEADRKDFESTARAGSTTSAESSSGVAERRIAFQTYVSTKGTFFSPKPLQTENGTTVSTLEGPIVSDGETEKLSFWGKCKNTMNVIAIVVQRYPSAAVVPLLLFCALTALGIFGCLAGAKSVENTNKSLAVSSAVDAGTIFTLQVEKAFTPLIALQARITEQPNYYEFVRSFPTFAQSLVSELPPDTITELQVSPMGIVMSTYPSNPGHDGLDIFNVSRLRLGAITTMELNELVLSGPLNLVVMDASNPTFAGIARQPIVLIDTDFDED
eukprot:gene11296-18932_t